MVTGAPAYAPELDMALAPASAPAPAPAPADAPAEAPAEAPLPSPPIISPTDTTPDATTDACGFPTETQTNAGVHTPLTSAAQKLAGPGTDQGARLFPFMARIEGPYGDCAGVLVAPGYVLTTARCVWVDSLAKPEDLKVTVGGKKVPAVRVHVKRGE